MTAWTPGQAAASDQDSVTIRFAGDEIATLVDALQRACWDFEDGRDSDEDYERCSALRDRVIGIIHQGRAS
jgi:hypothetical protein